MLPDDLRASFQNHPAHKSDHQKRVDVFMLKAEQEVPALPVLPSEKVRMLRAKLILEETLETITGLGFGVKVKPGAREVTKDTIEISADGQLPPSLIEIVDGCCDIKVVTTGTLSACGVPDDLVQYEVDMNNLAKFGPGGYRREDGKWVKPPGHQPPRIREIIEAMAG